MPMPKPRAQPAVALHAKVSSHTVGVRNRDPSVGSDVGRVVVAGPVNYHIVGRDNHTVPYHNGVFCFVAGLSKKAEWTLVTLFFEDDTKL